MTQKDTKHEKLDAEEIDDIKEPEETGEITQDSEVEELRQKLEEFDNNYKRALADYQNLQKRVSDERRDLIFSANKDLLLRILSILDTLVLANQHDGSEGLKVAIKQFLDVLKSEGVTKIETDGQEFDPYHMEAVAIDSGEQNKVIEEIRSGFMINDKVLRPAQVKVGKADKF